MSDDLHRRLEAVERAVTSDETALADLSDAATLDARLTALETRLDELTTTVQELDATTQALRGYLGGVDEVSAAVEQRADLALAKAETLERAVFDDADALTVERLPTETDSAAESPARPEAGPSPAADDALDDGPGASPPGTTPTASSSVSLRGETDDSTDDGTSLSLTERLRDAL